MSLLKPILFFAVVALAISGCGNELGGQTSQTQCANEGTDEEVCVTTRLSMPVDLRGSVVQTVIVSTRVDSETTLVYVESSGRSALKYDGPTEFRISTKAGQPATVTTSLRIVEEGYFTLNASASIEGVTDPVTTSIWVVMTHDGGTVTP